MLHVCTCHSKYSSENYSLQNNIGVKIFVQFSVHENNFTRTKRITVAHYSILISWTPNTVTVIVTRALQLQHESLCNMQQYLNMPTT